MAVPPAGQINVNIVDDLPTAKPDTVLGGGGWYGQRDVLGNDVNGADEKAIGYTVIGVRAGSNTVHLGRRRAQQ